MQNTPARPVYASWDRPIDRSPRPTCAFAGAERMTANASAANFNLLRFLTCECWGHDAAGLVIGL